MTFNNIFYQKQRDYKNHLANTRLVYTHLKAFFMLNPNMAMKFWISKVFERKGFFVFVFCFVLSLFLIFALSFAHDIHIERVNWWWILLIYTARRHNTLLDQFITLVSGHFVTFVFVMRKGFFFLVTLCNNYEIFTIQILKINLYIVEKVVSLLWTVLFIKAHVVLV